MKPNNEQLKAAEEKEFIRKAIRKIRKTPDVLFSSDPKVKSHEEKLTDLFVSLLAEREAKARKEGGERMVRAIEVAADVFCNPRCKVQGYHHNCEAHSVRIAARQALKDL